jgi:hypothetical protein
MDLGHSFALGLAGAAGFGALLTVLVGVLFAFFGAAPAYIGAHVTNSLRVHRVGGAEAGAEITYLGAVQT